MPRKPTALGTVQKKEIIEVTFNGCSGNLPEKLEKFLISKHSRGYTLIMDGKFRYFRGEYTPSAAKEFRVWLRKEGVVFPRKRLDE